MDSVDLGEILLLMLDDDLFWEEAEKQCGDTSTIIRLDATSEIAQ